MKNNFTCDKYLNCDELDECKYEKTQLGNSKKSHPRKTGNAYRRLMKKQKTAKLMKIINTGGYNPHAGYVDWDKVDGVWKPIGKYIKYPKDSNRQKFLKRQSNRAARRMELPTKGNGYRKCFDYWWALY